MEFIVDVEFVLEPVGITLAVVEVVFVEIGGAVCLPVTLSKEGTLTPPIPPGIETLVGMADESHLPVETVLLLLDDVF